MGGLRWIVSRTGAARWQALSTTVEFCERRMKKAIPTRREKMAIRDRPPEREHESHEPMLSTYSWKAATSSCRRKSLSAVMFCAKAPAEAQVSLKGCKSKRSDSHEPRACGVEVEMTRAARGRGSPLVCWNSLQLATPDW